MRIARSSRDLQVGWESLLFDFSTTRLFHGLDLVFAQRRKELSFRAVVSDAMSCNHEGQGGIQMLMDDGLASGQGGAPVGTLELHLQVAKANRVVPINSALVALREDHFQVPVPAG